MARPVRKAAARARRELLGPVYFPGERFDPLVPSTPYRIADLVYRNCVRIAHLVILTEAGEPRRLACLCVQDPSNVGVHKLLNNVVREIEVASVGRSFRQV